MASVKISMPDDFLLKLSILGDKTDETVPRVLEAGGEVVLKKVKSNLQTVLSGDSSGQLECSLGMSPAKLNRNGDHDIKIGFAENRNDGKSNAMLANVLEYGKSLQNPRPFLKPAKSQSKAACEAAMREALESELSKI